MEDEPIAMQKVERLLQDFKDKIVVIDKTVNAIEGVELGAVDEEI